MQVSYRKATLDDLDELVRLRIEFLREVQPVETHQYSEESLRSSLRDYLSRAMQADEFVAWLAIYNSEIVATSGLCFFQITPGFTLIDGKIAYILNIYTIRQWRGKGVGNETFNQILQEAIKRGYKRISLHASDDLSMKNLGFALRATKWNFDYLKKLYQRSRHLFCFEE